MANDEDVTKQNMRNVEVEVDNKSTKKECIDVKSDPHSSSKDGIDHDCKDNCHQAPRADMLAEQKIHGPKVENGIDTNGKDTNNHKIVEAGATDKIGTNKKPLKISKWKRLRNVFQIMKRKPKPSVKKTELIVESKVPTDLVSVSDQGDDYNYDLRSIPINIDQHDKGFNKQLNLKSILANAHTADQEKLTSNGKHRVWKNMTKAQRDEEKFRRQEEALKAYTTVYDLISGRMISYYELETKRKTSNFWI